MVDGVLVQCVSFICRSLLAFLLSVCTYVCAVYGFNLYVSGCVLVVPKVRCCVSHLLSFSRVCRLPRYCLWHL